MSCRVRNTSKYKVCYFFSTFSVCTKLQRSLTTWGGERERERGERDNSRRKERNIKSSKWSAKQHYTMTHFYYNVLLSVSPVGTLSLDRAVGGRRGVGRGQQYIPEYMTRCSRSDRSQPRLMKPKHFHRCFYTLGSTSSHRPNSTPALFLVQPALASV